MNFLILTDHRGHSKENSLYALARTLREDARTETMFVASKGDPRNDRFFAGDTHSTLYGLRPYGTSGFQFDATGQQFLEAKATTRLEAYDVVWLRLPPPADAVLFARLSSFAPALPRPEKPLQSSEATQRKKTARNETFRQYGKPVIINHPLGILETGSKDFLHHFPDFTAPVRRVQSVDDVREFAAMFPIVLKPLREYGGRGLVKIADNIAEEDGVLYPLNEWFYRAKADISAGNYLAMKFLKNVDKGDKRILVVNGEILGASLRIPAPGQWLCNVAMGGTSLTAEVTPEEEAMVATLAPVLLEKGIVIFGADTLTDDDGKRVLSELNTNSIGGFPQAEAQTGRPILQQTVNGIYDYLTERI